VGRRKRVEGARIEGDLLWVREVGPVGRGVQKAVAWPGPTRQRLGCRAFGFVFRLNGEVRQPFPSYQLGPNRRAHRGTPYLRIIYFNPWS
jgi:hypothetical protein